MGGETVATRVVPVVLAAEGVGLQVEIQVVEVGSEVAGVATAAVVRLEVLEVPVVVVVMVMTLPKSVSREVSSSAL